MMTSYTIMTYLGRLNTELQAEEKQSFSFKPFVQMKLNK